MLRTLITIILVALAFAAFSVGTFFETSRSETLAFNRKLQARFEATAIEIEVFQRANKRLPDAGEFEQLVDRTPIPGISSGLLGPSSGPNLVSGREVSNCGGNPKEQALLGKATYVLGMWNADWMECFSSSPQVSTLALTPKDLPKTRIVLVSRLIALFLLTGAALIMLPRWFKRKTV